MRYSISGFVAAMVVLISCPIAATGAEAAPASAGSPAVETIVILRHGEKPAGGLGQLTPQGLNRAIGLSVVLPEKFGKPDFIFAPDPAEKVRDGRGGSFNYVRPLMTIEPTAIRLGMPVQTPCGFTEIKKLDQELTEPKYAHALIFVAWEHGFAQKATVELLKQFGADTSKVPSWSGRDYDSLYVVKVTRTPGQAPTATFTHEQEGLDGESKAMPVPAAKK